MHAPRVWSFPLKECSGQAAGRQPCSGQAALKALATAQTAEDTNEKARSERCASGKRNESEALTSFGVCGFPGCAPRPLNKTSRFGGAARTNLSACQFQPLHRPADLRVWPDPYRRFHRRSRCTRSKAWPNTSVEARPNGKVPWPRGVQGYHPPRGQGTLPSATPHLER